MRILSMLEAPPTIAPLRITLSVSTLGKFTMSKNSQILLLPLCLFIPQHLKAAGSMNGQQVRWRNTEKAFGGTSSHSSWFCQEKIVSAETISPVPSTLGRREGSLSLSMQPEGLTIYCHESFPGTFCKDWGARPSVLTLCPLWSLHTAPKMPLEISIQYSPSLPLLNCYAMLMGSDTPSDSCEYVGPHCSYFH